MIDSPILLIAFNRPDLTRLVLSRLKEVGVRQLYVAVDGPRLDRPGEARLVQDVHDAVAEVDWRCEVQTLLRSENLGCARGVSGAITWFFSHVEEGIILEDDILPDPTFFPYAAELLDRYRDDHRVGAVSGCNLVPPSEIGVDASYRFTRLPHIWGWATWKRVWDGYDLDLRSWRDLWPESARREALGSPAAIRYWSRIFDLVARDEMDTWDYSFAYHCLKSDALTATSNVNLTENVGFRADATHTSAAAQAYIRPVQRMEFPLQHPVEVRADERSDAWTRDHVFGATHRAALMGRIRGAINRVRWTARGRLKGDLPSLGGGG